jgi:DNA (cytosine-5)-methyltransferase 1
VDKITEILISKRKELGLTQKEFADAIGLGLDGDRQVRSWENGEHRPSKDHANKILNFAPTRPYHQDSSKKYLFSFVDLFAGIGGIRIPFQEQGGFCSFTSEWDKFSQKTYKINFGHEPSGDITKVSPFEIPNHDILLAGFPCQAFSQAGLKKGFEDTRGTLFFEVQKILVHKRPKSFLLENVKQFKNHDKGRTFKTILEVLTGTSNIDKNVINKLDMSDDAKEALSTKLNYWVTYKVLKSNDFGVPQKRERVYIVGFDKDQFPKDFDFENNFSYPDPIKKKNKVGSILENNKKVDPKYTLSDRLWAGHQLRKKMHIEKGNGFGYSLFDKESEYTNTISARYYKDGSEVLISQDEIGKNPRRLTPRECAKLQGFPNDYIIPVSDSQAYKQFGNSVSVPVIRAISLKMIDILKSANLLSIRKSVQSLTLGE